MFEIEEPKPEVWIGIPSLHGRVFAIRVVAPEKSWEYIGL